ncbi:MAG: choice-of-anchor F family protein [Planctomycetota bacterium]
MFRYRYPQARKRRHDYLGDLRGGPGGGVAVDPVVLTVSEGNDNQPGGPGGDNNIVVPLKVFDTPEVIDIVFSVVDSSPSGTTEYRIVQSVDNDTGLPWDGYTLVLGFGSGGAFTPSPADDGLDFDFPELDPTEPESSAFSSVLAGQDTLVFSFGFQRSGAASYDFRIDVPDGINSFTLRQFPSAIPEPSSVLLALLPFAGAIAKRRR